MAIRRLRDAIRQVAGSRSTILISGESGTGKELVARALHDQSPRRGGPFIAVNCAAIPENLIESELFGHERGAFTDAHAARQGRFELAEGGTLFLDEIGDLSLRAQGTLLRVIEERAFTRLGGTQPVCVDVRLVGATHIDLDRAVADGRFRQDLYYRLHVVPLVVPPLRERPDDIPLLLQHFMIQHTPSGTLQKTLAPDLVAALTRYGWPGNVREMENLIEQLITLSAGQEINLAELPAT
ncbi:MAG: sigma-54 dependent transcriptional regulator, partial [Nitrospiria bacterium]